MVRFESSKKSNNIRMRGPRDTKFSHDVELEVGTRCTRDGVAVVWPLGGALKKL